MRDFLKNIDYSIILAKRIINELDSKNFKNALYLSDTFVYLFPSKQPATADIVTKYINLSRMLLRDGNPEQADTLVSKALILDPENIHLQSLLVTIKREQQKLLGESDSYLVSDSIRLISPTELERSEVEFYLSQNVNALLITIGRTEAISLGAEFSPETAKNKAEAWLDSVRERLRKKICKIWSYCEKQKDERLRDKVILATTIGNLIVPIVGQVPPLVVACLLVNMGIEEFCGNDKN